MEVVWLVGRGVTVDCGLSWREERGDPGRLRAALARAQAEGLARGEIDPGCLDRLLSRLRAAGGAHCFVTTNWNTLLDTALRRHGLPPALHLNGSIDGDELLPPEAPQDARRVPLEAHEGFRRLAAARTGVLAGLSLEGRLDRELLARLGRAQARPGETRWIVVNPEAAQAHAACELLGRCFPGAALAPVRTTFAAWVDAGMPELFA